MLAGSPREVHPPAPYFDGVPELATMATAETAATPVRSSVAAEVSSVATPIPASGVQEAVSTEAGKDHFSRGYLR